MAEEPRTNICTGTEMCDWLRVFTAARMALHPSKLGLALAAVLVTCCWGVILNAIWRIAGSDVGIAPFDRLLDCGCCWTAAGGMCGLVRGLLASYPCFSVFLLLGSLAIWSLFGGAICRIAAVEFAREDKIGMREALSFAREKFISGFFVSPLLPIGIMLVIGLVMSIGGAVLAIPGIGNSFALLFPLALLGGVAIAFVLIGFVGGGSFFWPTVAVEGSDGFDAISRSFSYFFGRPVKTIFYGLTASVWGSICWSVLALVLWLMLRTTHACMSLGAGGFGTGWWGMRGENTTKLDVLWQLPTIDQMYAMGDRTQMGGWEIFAAVCIGVFVLIAIGFLWAFLASFYFSSSTIIYYLLRHDVDATDYEDVYIEEPEEEPTTTTVEPAAPTSDTAPSPEEALPAKEPAPSEPPPDKGKPDEPDEIAETADEADETEKAKDQPDTEESDKPEENDEK